MDDDGDREPRERWPLGAPGVKQNDLWSWNGDIMGISGISIWVCLKIVYP